MDYSVNSGCWGSIFAVPNAIIDNYIKLVSGSTLKVMLFILRNNSIQFTRTEIASAVGITEENVDEAFCFLEQTGIFTSNPFPIPNLPISSIQEVPQALNKDQPESMPIDTQKEKFATIRSSSNFQLKPTEISERMDNSPDIRNLIDTAQQCLNRQLTPTEMRSFIWIYEYVGLPNTVILMLIQYCLSIGKTSARYIETVAIDWQEKGITTFEEAQSETKHLDAIHSYSFKLFNLFGINRSFSPKEKSLVDIWYERDYSIDVVGLAYNKCVDATGKLSIPYMSKILDNWYNNNLFTVGQIEGYAANDSKKELPISKAKRMRDGDQPLTYNLDNIDQLAVNYLSPEELKRLDEEDEKNGVI